ncbi:MAG: HAD family hydrolase [Pseudomonadota bacterium]|nr:HAD family hydrolase [Pseudomonadota bacterium]
MKHYKTIIFDLFNTVVLWEPRKIPTFIYEDREFRSTNMATYQTLGKYRKLVSFPEYHRACQTVTAQLTEKKKQSTKEISSLDRFSSILKSLDFIDAETANVLAKKIVSTHMGILTAATFIPKAHIFELRRLHLEYQIGLLSNFDDSQTVKRILESAEIDQFFKSTVVSEKIGVRKPSQKIFAISLSELNADPEETLFVGDSWEEDIVGAMDIGMDAIWINADRHKIPTPKGSLCTESSVRCLPSITELSHFLQNLA